jgi:uncharacterized protein
MSSSEQQQLQVLPDAKLASAHPVKNAHPVKTERHDTLAYVHQTNTGQRPVEVYRQHQKGLYVARAFQNHPRVAYWQAHLLPGLLDDGLSRCGLGLQVCRYDFHGERDHDYYIDIATITQCEHLWTVRDHYLDVLVWNGLSAEIIDTDELNAAIQAGYIDEREYAAAMAGAHRVLGGLAMHGYDLRRWLHSFGVRLDWNEQAVGQYAELV